MTDDAPAAAPADSDRPTEPRPPLEVTVAAASDVGQVREDNEDSFLVERSTNGTEFVNGSWRFAGRSQRGSDQRFGNSDRSIREPHAGLTKQRQQPARSLVWIQ